MQANLKLKIADIIVDIHSDATLIEVGRFDEPAESVKIVKIFNNFICNEKLPADISIIVRIVRDLPAIKDIKSVFTAYHFADGKENWQLLEKNNHYIYTSSALMREQVMIMNKEFNKITAYFLPAETSRTTNKELREFIEERKGYIWTVPDILFNFLQILFMNYLAFNNRGIIMHASGIREIDGSGLVFVGGSGCGKTTIARFWHNHTKVTVLNDDRIIASKINNAFVIYTSPWYGEFSDYFSSMLLKPTYLKRLFFVYFSRENTIKEISKKEAFNLLYQNIFPPFWNKRHMEKTISFCQDMTEHIKCYSLGCVNSENIIKFVRKIK